MPAAPQEPTFHIGLSMAGAISAGAYTAGVFDYLIEALEIWEHNRQFANVPMHRVSISAISGASAGGIVGALGLVAVADKNRNVTSTEQHKYTLPRLYKAWVDMVSFNANEHSDGFFGQSDSADNVDGLRSVLDSSLLAKICQKSFSNISAIGAPKPFIAQQLHLFLTHTNVCGVNYQVPFSGVGGSGYPMTNHADRVHYLVSGIGSVAFTSPWADSDLANNIDISTVKDAKVTWQVMADPELTAKSTDVWTHYANCTLATGAFPIALTPRIIMNNTLAHYRQRQWPMVVSSAYRAQFQFTLKPDVVGNDDLVRPYVAVDGGVTNNEPFELCRFALMKNPPQPNVRSEVASGGAADVVDRAVIMVDPFPEPSHDVQAEFSHFHDDMKKQAVKPIVTEVLARLIPTLKQQSRCKFEQFVQANDESVFSRYLIAPTKENDAYPLACGLLGGFGGFLAITLREHDYQLGRYNCYQFLKEHFCMPAQFALIKAGYSNVTGQQYDCRSGDKQIIPIFEGVAGGMLASPVPAPPSKPKISKDQFEAFAGQLKTRSDFVFKTLLNQLNSGWWMQLGLHAAWRLSLRKKVLDSAKAALAKDLKDRGLATVLYFDKSK